jgi:hypothetical protein
MKKNYIAPSMEMTSIELQQMVAASNGVYSGNGITYGGVDTKGEKDPASRRRSVWDDDEEDDF